MFEFAAPSWLSTAGIACDISGAVALARGLFFVPDEKLRRQAGSYFGSNPSAYRAFVEQRLDTRFGLAQLLAGFTFQAIAAVGISVPFAVAAVIAGLIPVAWLIYLHNFSYWVVRNTLRMTVRRDSLERIWREVHFPDIPDLLWGQVILNEGITFAKEPTQ
ncbi:hypothetical protein [uncultured Nitratireductor sp.]|uniref:hypothetical protein n=1 Tax=uncultured Nitratireductor sp. TaxID=520953 RepID=UPI00261D0E49|nr:hypothetical protein [uncultured Nitratireductor sp.]